MSDTNDTNGTTIADTRDPRDVQLAALDEEARRLRSENARLRVDEQAQRTGRVEAEHQRDTLINGLGRELVAAALAFVPREAKARGLSPVSEAEGDIAERAVARLEVVERERDEARKRAEKAEYDLASALARVAYLDRLVDEERRERDDRLRQAEQKREDERVRKVDMQAERNAARRERDEARAEVARLAPLSDAYHQIRKALVIGGGDLADGETVTPADVVALVAKQERRLVEARKERDEARSVANNMRLEAGLEGRVFPWDRAELVDLVALAAQARREAGEPVRCDAPTGAVREAVRAEAQPGKVGAVEVERKPPFRDWTDETRAKLVPGATVVWWESRGVPPRRMTVFAIEEGSARGPFVKFAPFYSIDGGYLFNCDPLTIEPPTAEETLRQFERREASAAEVRERLKLPEVPATQAEPVRPDAPDLRPGDQAESVSERVWTIVPQPCVECGERRTDAHHPDYRRPLHVIWLCRRCHARVHAQAKK